MTVGIPLMHGSLLIAGEDSPVPASQHEEERIWTVRISSSRKAGDAWAFMTYLKKKGYHPVMVALRDARDKVWRVVQMGEYPTRSQARVAGKMFRKRTGLDYLIRSMPVALLKERTLESPKSPLPVLDAKTPEVKSPDTQALEAKRSSNGVKASQKVSDFAGRKLVGAAESLFYELDQHDILRATDYRQQQVILARIKIRRGYIDEGLRLYASLLHIYPDDVELREEYIGALIDNKELEKAEAMLRDWLGKDSQSPRALRQEARLRLVSGNYALQMDTLDYLLRLRPGDMDSLSAKAYGSQQGGDWLGAIESFSALIDADPDNHEARQALSNLLMERRPRLGLFPSVYLQADETVTSTLGSRFAMQLTDQIRGELYYTNTRISRPEGTGTEAIHKNVNQAAMLFKHDFTRTLTGVAGLGAFEGTASGASGLLGLDWRLHDTGTLSAMMDLNNPWLDEPSAANYEGRYHQFSLTYDSLYDDTWGLFLNGQFRQYQLESAKKYGEKHLYNIILTRRLLADPDLFVSYSFYRSMFNYADADYRPFTVLEKESTHALSTSFSKLICDTILARLAGGIRFDTYKNSPGYFGGPSIEIRLGRFLLNFDYEYSSDSVSAGGGETHLFKGGIDVVF